MNEFNLPDPNDRSPNQPVVLVSPSEVLEAFFKYTKKDVSIVTEEVKGWYISATKMIGWSDAYFTGCQCILTRHFTCNEV